MTGSRTPSRSPGLAATLLILFLPVLTLPPVRAQVTDLSGRPGGLAGRVEAALQSVSGGEAGSRFAIALGFTGLMASDAEVTAGGTIVIHRASGWMSTGISGLMPVRNAWDDPDSDDRVLDLQSMSLTNPPPAPVLEERRLLCFLSGRLTGQAEPAVRGLSLREPIGHMYMGERPLYWVGDVTADDLLAWARSRLATLDPDSDDDLRVELVGLVSLLPVSEAAGVLTGLAEDDPDGDVRRRAIIYLGRRPENTVARLERIYDSAEDPDDRARALTTLADRQGPAAKNRLLRAARDEQEAEEIRTVAISYLSRVEGRDVDETFERLLADPDPDLRRRVVSAWERRDPSRAVPLLEGVASGDEERNVREAAVASLGDIDDPLAAAALQRLFDSSSDERVRRRALRERVAQISEISDRVTLLAGIARTDMHLEVRKDAVRYLGQIDDPSARRALRQILDIGRR